MIPEPVLPLLVPIDSIFTTVGSAALATVCTETRSWRSTLPVSIWSASTLPFGGAAPAVSSCSAAPAKPGAGAEDEGRREDAEAATAAPGALAARCRAGRAGAGLLRVAGLPLLLGLLLGACW